MNCPNCGNPLGLEDEVCPFCGAPNTFAQKHQADMEHYERAFRKTQQEVSQKASRTASYMTPMILIAVMVLLNVAALAISHSSYRIADSIINRRITRNAAEHRENIEAYLEDGNYFGMSSYYDQNDLYYGDEFEEYDALVSAANDYYYIYSTLVDKNDYSFSEDSIDSTIRSLCNNLQDLYDIENSYSYHKDTALTEDKMEYISDIRHQTEALFITYASLSADEAASLGDLSAKRQQELLKERLEPS